MTDKIKNAVNAAVYHSCIDYQLELVLDCLWGIAMDDTEIKEIKDIISEVESLRSRLNDKGQKVLEILEKEFDHAN